MIANISWPQSALNFFRNRVGYRVTSPKWCFCVDKLLWLLLKKNLQQFPLTKDPCFSIYFNSERPKTATERTKEPLPVHNQSNIKLNTSICLSFIYIACRKSTANLKMVDNVIHSSDTWILVHGELCWLDYRIRKLLDWSSDWLSACSEWRND